MIIIIGVFFYPLDGFVELNSVLLCMTVKNMMDVNQLNDFSSNCHIEQKCMKDLWQTAHIHTHVTHTHPAYQPFTR